MQRIGAFLGALLRGPAGGMLACILLAAMLGGIAMANPEALVPQPGAGHARGGASHGTLDDPKNGRRGDDSGGSGQAAAGAADGAHGEVSGPDGVAGCRALTRLLEQDLERGEVEHLATAIDVVWRNCRRHDAPGLIRALERLIEKAERRTAADERTDRAKDRADGRERDDDDARGGSGQGGKGGGAKHAGSGGGSTVPGGSGPSGGSGTNAAPSGGPGNGTAAAAGPASGGGSGSKRP